MLCLTLKNQVIDLLWPNGRRLVMRGPTDRDSAIRVSTPDGEHVRHYATPRTGRYTHIDVAGLSFGLIGRQGHGRGGCSVQVDAPREVRVLRRQDRQRSA